MEMNNINNEASASRRSSSSEKTDRKRPRESETTPDSVASSVLSLNENQSKRSSSLGARGASGSPAERGRGGPEGPRRRARSFSRSEKINRRLRYKKNKKQRREMEDAERHLARLAVREREDSLESNRRTSNERPPTPPTRTRTVFNRLKTETRKGPEPMPRGKRRRAETQEDGDRRDERRRAETREDGDRRVERRREEGRQESRHHHGNQDQADAGRGKGQKRRVEEPTKAGQETKRGRKFPLVASDRPHRTERWHAFRGL